MTSSLISFFTCLFCSKWIFCEDLELKALRLSQSVITGCDVTLMLQLSVASCCIVSHPPHPPHTLGIMQLSAELRGGRTQRFSLSERLKPEEELNRLLLHQHSPPASLHPPSLQPSIKVERKDGPAALPGSWLAVREEKSLKETEILTRVKLKEISSIPPEIFVLFMILN